MLKCNYLKTKGWFMSLQAQKEKYLKTKARVAKLNDDDHLLMLLKVMSIILLIALLYS